MLNFVVYRQRMLMFFLMRVFFIFLFRFHFISITFFSSIKLFWFASGFSAFIFSFAECIILDFAPFICFDIFATCSFFGKKANNFKHKQYVMFSSVEFWLHWNHNCNIWLRILSCLFIYYLFFYLVGWMALLFFWLLLKSTSVCSARQNVNACWTHSNYNINNKNAIETKSHT